MQENSSVIERNKSLVRDFFEALNNQNLEAFDDLIDQDYTDHNPANDAEGQSGREELKQYFAGINAAMDPEYVVNDIIAEDNKVVVRNLVHGTHQAELMGVEATGKRLTAEAVQIYRIENGRLTEHWEIADNLGLLQQLDVVDIDG